MRKNKDVLVYLKENRQKLFLVACQLRHGVSDAAELVPIVEKAGYRFLSCFVSTPDSDGYSRCSFFLEAIEGRPSIDDVREAIGRCPQAENMEAKEGRNGIIVDTLNFPLSWSSGDRAVMLRAQFFATMEEGLEKIFNSGADVVLREMGYHHGRPTWENLLRGYPLSSRADLDEVVGYYGANGWARSEVVSVDFGSKKAVIRMRENFECTSKRQGGTGSNFVLGHLQGLFSVVFGDGTKVAETRCLCRGDPYCEFTVG